MTIPSLETEHASASYDDITNLVHIAYRGELGADATRQVYDWLEDLYEAIGVDAIHGQVFDFRKVTQFLEENLQAARRVSKLANIRADTSRIPIALLVSEFFQQEILRSAMRITPDHDRKHIVWSEKEAVEFLTTWREKHLLAVE